MCVFAVPVKHKIHPSLMEVHFESITEENFFCDSSTIPVWFYSQVEEFDGVLDFKVAEIMELYLKEIGELQSGFYFCYGRDKKTREAFISSAELTVYGNFSCVSNTVLFHNGHYFFVWKVVNSRI